MDAKLKAAIDFAMSDPFTSLPNEAKQGIIVEYAQKYGCTTLIETGTNTGDTVEITRRFFKDVHSVELGPHLHAAAVVRFAPYNNVHIHLGDAGEVLWTLIPTIDEKEPLIFYLDAHSRYDEGSPEGKGIGTSAPQEIQAIAKLRPDSVVLIDDARLFTHQFNTDWPKLEDTVLIIESLNLWNIEVLADMIRLVPLGR